MVGFDDLFQSDQFQDSRILEVLQKREVPPHFLAGIGDFWVGGAGTGV